MAIDNTIFDNREAGVAIEEANGVLVRRNTVTNNTKAQLLVIRAEYDSNDNCFRNGAPDQLTADFVFVDHYKTLADYQRGKHQDLHSREGTCGSLPAKIDVRKLHAETMSYTERARKKLAGSR
jgi:parallel beta-helix repeat protein